MINGTHLAINYSIKHNTTQKKVINKILKKLYNNYLENIPESLSEPQDASQQRVMQIDTEEHYSVVELGPESISIPKKILTFRIKNQLKYKKKTIKHEINKKIRVKM